MEENEQIENNDQNKDIKIKDTEKMLGAMEKIEKLAQMEKQQLQDKIQELYKTIEVYEKTMELTMAEKQDLHKELESYEKTLEMSTYEKRKLMESIPKQVHIETLDDLEKKRLKHLNGREDYCLQTENLIKDFKKMRAVDGVSIELKRGEVVGLLGPNGAGKTTTFYMIVGLERPSDGRVYFNNKDITHHPMYKRARMGINYLPQESSIFRKLSVRDNIMSILELRKELSNKQRKEKADELLDRLDIEYITDQKAYALSGGERRRVEIARALAADPKFLLLDEPFAGIDPIAVQEIQGIIHRLVEETGVGILITDHNARETLRITDRAYIIVEGTIFTSGSSKELATREEVKKIYLGDNFQL